MDPKQVSDTIRKQIGAKALFLIGAKKFVYTPDGGLRFKVGRNKLNANMIHVKLNGKDLYDIQFWSIRGASGKVKKQVDDVYAEDLRKTIGHELGLVTSFPKIVMKGARGTDEDAGGECAPMGEFGPTGTTGPDGTLISTDEAARYNVGEAEAYAMREPVIDKRYMPKEKPSKPGPISVSVYLPREGGDPEALVAALKSDKELGGAVNKGDLGDVHVSVMAATYADAETMVRDALKRIGWEQAKDHSANKPGPYYPLSPAVYGESDELLYTGPLTECLKFQRVVDEATTLSVPVTSVAAIRKAQKKAAQMAGANTANAKVWRTTKKTKQMVNYVDKSTDPKKRCGDCAWVQLAQTGCRKVAGQIKQDGSCDLFKQGIKS